MVNRIVIRDYPAMILYKRLEDDMMSDYDIELNKDIISKGNPP